MSIGPKIDGGGFVYMVYSILGRKRQGGYPFKAEKSILMCKIVCKYRC